jgi:hypothetical protein
MKMTYLMANWAAKRIQGLLATMLLRGNTTTIFSMKIDEITLSKKKRITIPRTKSHIWYLDAIKLHHR